MLVAVDDRSFESFINGSFYAAVGFYHPTAGNKDEMFRVMEEFIEGHGNVASATLDIIGQAIPEEYGITEDESPIIVVFKQGKPIKAINVFTVENLSSAIAPPGKNITLQ
ncbi:MAG: hypothetical protein ACYCVD_11005 [Desulfitobacteriaceae bacterium]